MNCPYCGAPIIGNAKFCMNCGAAAPYSDESPLSYAEASAPVSQAYRPEITSVQDLPPQFRPMSPWAYLGCSLLFSIPLIGFLCLLIFTFSKENINRRNYARSYWCAILVVLILFAVLAATGVLSALADTVAETATEIMYSLN